MQHKILIKIQLYNISFCYKIINHNLLKEYWTGMSDKEGKLSNIAYKLVTFTPIIMASRLQQISNIKASRNIVQSVSLKTVHEKYIALNQVIKTKIYNYKFYVYSSSKFKFQLFKAFKNLNDFLKIAKKVM